MASENATGSEALIIIGMHRSGTSLVASMLHSAGLDVGKQLMSAHETINAKGFYENLEFVRFHEAALESLGESRFGWTTRYNLPVAEGLEKQVDDLLADNRRAGGVWGWKDPRTTLFLTYWAARLPEAKFVFIHRPPWEVVDSLYRRGDQVFRDSPRLAVDIWTTYNRAILEFMESNPERGLLTGVQSIVDNPTAFIERINERFALNLRKPGDDIFDEKLIERSSGDTSRARIIQRFFPDCRKTYEELIEKSENFGGQPEKLSSDTISDITMAELFLEEWSEARNAQRELKDTNKTLYEVRSQLYHTSEKLQALERSRLWKLRNIVHRLKQR